MSGDSGSSVLLQLCAAQDADEEDEQTAMDVLVFFWICYCRHCCDVAMCLSDYRLVNMTADHLALCDQWVLSDYGRVKLDFNFYEPWLPERRTRLSHIADQLGP